MTWNAESVWFTTLALMIPNIIDRLSSDSEEQQMPPACQIQRHRRDGVCIWSLTLRELSNEAQTRDAAEQ
jgi:hypothetical protein